MHKLHLLTLEVLSNWKIKYQGKINRKNIFLDGTRTQVPEMSAVLITETCSVEGKIIWIKLFDFFLNYQRNPFESKYDF